MDMNDAPYSIKMISQRNVSPPPNSVPETSIPLTLFDMPWILGHGERILFYELPRSTLQHWTQTILPSLEHSLSLTLHHFFPLVASLVCPPLPTPPYLRYQDGDSIPLTFAESNGDFHRLVKNCPKGASEFLHLIPHLPDQTSFLSSDTFHHQVRIHVLHSMIAVQVTIFPDSGIAICYAYRHVVGDGRSIGHFMKSWASMFKSKNDSSLILVQPLLNREDFVQEPNGLLLPILCNQFHQFGLSWDKYATITAVSPSALDDKLHATFVLTRQQIDKLKSLIASELNTMLHVSTFVAAYAFTLTCLIKTESKAGNGTASYPISSSDDDLFYYFGFVADCTGRVEFQVPKTYFGNCLTFCFISALKSDLLGENGLSVAAKALMKEVKELENGLLINAERWLPNAMEKAVGGKMVSVAGSPKLRVYETDFGWGKPKKSEVIHIDKGKNSISISESRDEEGGIEIGMALHKVCMDAFISIFELDLQNHLC